MSLRVCYLDGLASLKDGMIIDDSKMHKSEHRVVACADMTTKIKFFEDHLRVDKGSYSFLDGNGAAVLESLNRIVDWH
jgi:hypothetical protein